jgi:glucosamine--fructose-6-phosphate aminotransferase (isomerizing)
MTLMLKESLEAPDVVARFLVQNDAALVALGERLRALQPPVVLMAARGSSDHASTYFKYLCEIVLGVPCASIGSSVTSIWHSKLVARNALCLTISQSGQSPDIVSLQAAAKAAGAFTIAVVNAEGSAVAHGADMVLPLCAGPERSVAATKSFIASMVAGAAIIGHWKQDDALLRGLKALPEVLRKAAKVEWPTLQKAAVTAPSLYVLGRGPGLATAAETALKFKETCGIHAEALSFAEVMHGPLELVRKGFPILAFAPDDAARQTTNESLARLRAAGAEVFVVGRDGLPFAASAHTLLDPVSMIQSAYPNIEAIARRLGRDPDRPRLLSKVTETV